ncbi:urea carboxylase [Pseudanabaena sp. PCC 6802]|uniref:urea carboxylase n=1 Tax=Pseudanabaena sp. PCC 6802 TaxID=118173 RepID=UPI00034952E9|nr:urea carboxylase [Pseudanabaena sp. PCC 6802]
MFTKVLVANRGEIACRVIRTLDRLGIDSVAVYSEADTHAQHVTLAKEAICLGGMTAAESYLRYDRLLEIALAAGVKAIHPGYGFLSENAEFAEACADAGIQFIGPTPTQLRQFGLKHIAREIAAQNQVSMLPGSDLLENVEQAREVAKAIAYPVMLKSTAGGGGIGMQVCDNEAELERAYDKVKHLSEANFKQSGIFLEKYIQTARHIEVQIFGDGNGKVIALGERDCSTQRRNQKVIEETPAPGISDRLRQVLCDAAVRLGEAVAYRSAGTVEYIFDVDAQEFYFLEVNTRLQVEHGVTEMVCDVDLVEWMVRLAAGDRTFLDNYHHQPQGHAMQVRIYAEDANKQFQPSSGLLDCVKLATGVRWDSWIESGTEVTPFYDPLLAKLIVHGSDRVEAISKLQTALAESKIAGIETNLDYLRQVVSYPDFVRGQVSTRLLGKFIYRPQTIDVLDPGTFTTIQDYPGRVGYWDIGVPPSGPMDSLAFRLGNRILGNPELSAALECTMLGPTLKFNCDTTICLTGAAMRATLDGNPVSYWRAIPVKTGSTLKLKGIEGAGYRTYVAIRHGFDVPEYLGSRSTFTLGQFGGHGGRTLRKGDVLHITNTDNTDNDANSHLSLPCDLIPQYTSDWEVAVFYGPHGAPDFFTNSDIAMLFSQRWTIHHNSARTGIRLIGPKPQWARANGGEAGLHPSNIHDNAYAIGTIDFTGDMPIILAHDGPSLGGFVCPATIVQAELWKIGQMKPGDTVRFYPIDPETASELECIQEEEIFTLRKSERSPVTLTNLKENLPEITSISPVLQQIPETQQQIAVTYRQAGDKYLLIEYGPLILDLNLRFRVHALMLWLQELKLPGIVDLTPGIRSLQIHYDSRQLPRQKLLDILATTEQELPDLSEVEVASRVVHLPLSWDDASTQLAIAKYMQSVRDNAPWCPSNLEFIRRINGLRDIEQVREIVFSASYLVLGLGDVYLGAPVATPIDPRHRLVTTKYNPARTWTPENAVGIGGAYLCIYGMEGPGGYQFVGRTVPVWNRYKQTADFSKPWLLRFFDRIRFFPVSAEELLRYREDVIQGKVKLEIEEQTFRLKQYQEFLQNNAESIATFKTQQQSAFAAERDRWAIAGEFDRQESFATDPVPDTPEIEIPDGQEALLADFAGTVWQILVQSGDIVAEGQSLIILEAMKMEISLVASSSGKVGQILCQTGQAIAAGQILLSIEIL